MKELCKVEGCCNLSFRRGYCSKHYHQILDCGEIYKTEHEAYCESRSKLISSVLQDMKSGMTRDEVQSRHGIDLGQLKWILREHGDESLKIDQSLTAEQIAQKLICNGTALQYAGEYKRGQYVLLHCNVCGSTMRYAGSALFRHVNCKQCKENAKHARQLELEAQREADRKAKAEAAAERKRIQEQERAAKMREVSCTVCGTLFTTTNQRRFTCSSECSRKRENTLKSRKNDKRIPKDKRIDRIDLHDLFKRDNGVCHICGKQCNWNDYTVTDTTIIAGNWYPSVDHILPVSLGGSDSWDNVMLAHRICNSIRGNNVE